MAIDKEDTRTTVTIPGPNELQNEQLQEIPREPKRGEIWF